MIATLNGTKKGQEQLLEKHILGHPGWDQVTKSELAYTLLLRRVFPFLGACGNILLSLLKCHLLRGLWNKRGEMNFNCRLGFQTCCLALLSPCVQN